MQNRCEPIASALYIFVVKTINTPKVYAEAHRRTAVRLAKSIIN
jgi:hypothetical protein